MKGRNKKPSSNARNKKPASNQSSFFFLGVILVLTFFIYSKSTNNGFVTWDDPEYISDNNLIKDFSIHGIKNIFTSFYEGNYHPLTALSNAVEFHNFGLNPKPYHIDNLILHLLNVVLVFLVIVRLSGRRDAALVVASFFALHPMHVESVAWIAERKDVLYSFFYLLAWLLYIEYLKKGFKLKYLLYSLLFFACSLLSKSMAVTLPLVFLLTDYYYKRFEILDIKCEARIASSNLKSILLSKIPYFVLSLLFGIVAIYSQSNSGSTEMAPHFPYLQRILLTCYGLVYYIFKAFIPVHLSAFHPYPEQRALSLEFYVATVIFLLLLVLIFRSKNFKRELVFGMLFFLVAIAPVIQLMPVGKALTAERYSYIPYIGLFFIVATFYGWAVDKLKAANSNLKLLPAFAVAIYIVIFSVITYQRIDKWKDGIVLFTDIIEKYPESSGIDFAWYNRGLTKNNMGDYKGAIEDYSEAIHVNPKYVQAWYNRGYSKGMSGEFKSAIPDFDEAIHLYPTHFMAYNNRGNAKGMLNDLENALRDFSSAINIKPDYAEAYFNRGFTYLKMGHNSDACNDWRKATSMGYDKAGELMQKYCM